MNLLVPSALYSVATCRLGPTGTCYANILKITKPFSVQLSVRISSGMRYGYIELSFGLMLG